MIEAKVIYCDLNHPEYDLYIDVHWNAGHADLEWRWFGIAILDDKISLLGHSFMIKYKGLYIFDILKNDIVSSMMRYLIEEKHISMVLGFSNTLQYSMECLNHENY